MEFNDKIYTLISNTTMVLVLILTSVLNQFKFAVPLWRDRVDFSAPS